MYEVDQGQHEQNLKKKRYIYICIYYKLRNVKNYNIL